MLFCWDHKGNNTRSVFTMDRVFSFYVKTPPQVLVKGFQAFWTVFTSCCHLSQGNPVWEANDNQLPESNVMSSSGESPSFCICLIILFFSLFWCVLSIYIPFIAASSLLLSSFFT